MFAQLRDMLAAEDSAVVAQENDHGGIGCPQRAKPNGRALRVRQRDIR
jgi:hypothetical protein